MSDGQGVNWGKVLIGAAVVTTAVAAGVFIGKDLGPVVGEVSKGVGQVFGAVGDFVGQAIKGFGTLIAGDPTTSTGGIGGWIAHAVKGIAEFTEGSTARKAVALGAAAVVGGAAVAATTSCVDRINQTTAPVTGRG